MSHYLFETDEHAVAETLDDRNHTVDEASA